MSLSCPLCNETKTVDFVYPPYKTCLRCQHTYQPDPPPKVWLNPEKGSANGFVGSKMNDREKASNKFLADWLYQKFEPSLAVDVGSGYPFFAECLSKLGATTIATDGCYDDNLIDLNDIDSSVRTISLDWENDNFSETNVDLITAIHVMEHFYNPLSVIQRFYDILAPDGAVYVRLPNKDIQGIQRDFTEGHVQIHPSIYGTKSLKYAFEKCGFHLVWMEHQNGFGQTSCIFKKHKPTISLFMIVKNEEDNIVACLDSVRDFCDEMIVLDTGSTDNTVIKAIEAGAEVHRSEQFDQNTTLEEFHFAEARNEAMSYASGDWLFWMDADDTFEGEIQLSPYYDAYNLAINDKDAGHTHCRFFRRGWCKSFSGKVHEAPNVRQCRIAKMDSALIRHKNQFKPGRAERNLALLETEYKKDPNNKRTIFYLANAYYDMKKLKEAISKYRKYIKTGGNWHDELVIAYFQLANCYFLLKHYKEAIRQSFLGLTVDDRWAEFYCRIGESYYHLKDFKKAIPYFLLAKDLDIPKTNMWVRKEFYGPVPNVYLSLCYEGLGDLEKAIFYADSERKEKLLKKELTIEVVRPGALGDIIATTPSLKEIRKEHPEAYIRYVCHPSGNPLLENNPNVDEISAKESDCDLRLRFQYPMNEGYPDTPMRKHLAEHFADSVGVKLPKNWSCELNLPTSNRKISEPYIAFAVKTGWSEYKEWPFERWEELIKRMKSKYPDINWVQLGGPNEPEINGAEYTCGKTSLIESFQILRDSLLFVGLDSVFNHACNALDVPAVIMFGSTHPTGSGYKNQTNLVAELDCQPCYRETNPNSVHKKPPCPFGHECMKSFMTVDLVEQAVSSKLAENVQI